MAKFNIWYGDKEIPIDSFEEHNASAARDRVVKKIHIEEI